MSLFRKILDFLKDCDEVKISYLNPENDTSISNHRAVLIEINDLCRLTHVGEKDDIKAFFNDKISVTYLDVNNNCLIVVGVQPGDILDPVLIVKIKIEPK